MKKELYQLSWDSKKFKETLNNPPIRKVDLYNGLNIIKSTYTTWLIPDRNIPLYQIVRICNHLHISICNYIIKTNTETGEMTHLIESDNVSAIPSYDFHDIEFRNVELGRDINKKLTFREMASQLKITQIGFQGWFRDKGNSHNYTPQNLFDHCQKLNLNPIKYLSDPNYIKNEVEVTTDTKQDKHVTPESNDSNTTSNEYISIIGLQEEQIRHKDEQINKLKQELSDERAEVNNLLHKIKELQSKYIDILEQVIESSSNVTIHRSKGYVIDEEQSLLAAEDDIKED